MQRLWAGQGQGVVGNRQPVEFEARRKLRRVAFERGGIEAAFGPRRWIKRVIQVARQLIDLQQPLRPVFQGSHVAQRRAMLAIRLIAQGPVFGRAIRFFQVRREQRQTFFVQTVAQVAQPEPVVALNLAVALRRHFDPGVACTDPVLQRIRLDHRQP